MDQDNERNNLNESRGINRTNNNTTNNNINSLNSRRDEERNNFNNSNRNDPNQLRSLALFSISENPGDPKNPRDTEFFSFTKNFCCPTFEFLSFSFSIVVLFLIMYAVTIAFGVYPNSSVFLGVNDNTLVAFGYKDAYRIQHGQIWRFITYGILSADFIQFITNSVIFLVLSTLMEKLLGTCKVILMFFVTV